MFAMDFDLGFAQADTAASVRTYSVEDRDAMVPLAGVHEGDTFTDIIWSALLRLATLSQSARPPPEFYVRRLSLLMDHPPHLPEEHPVPSSRYDIPATRSGRTPKGPGRIRIASLTRRSGGGSGHDIGH